MILCLLGIKRAFYDSTSTWKKKAFYDSTIKGTLYSNSNSNSLLIKKAP